MDPQVGEFCTSFDMAGASLTLLWLDDELESLWLAPADTPAFRTGAVDAGSLTHVDSSVLPEAAEESIPPASEDSRRAAAHAAAALAAVRDVIDENAEELGRLDAIAGDGDHGIGMKRGSVAACAAAAAAVGHGAGVQTVLARAADAWSDRAGGTSGALWGVILRALGDTLGDTRPVAPTSVSAAVSAATRAVMDYGKAVVGDKTMVDALVPFADMLADRVGPASPSPRPGRRRPLPQRSRPRRPKSSCPTWAAHAHTATRRWGWRTPARCRSPSSSNVCARR